MKEGFDRLAEFDRVRANGHSNDCAVGIVCHAAPCTCGCIPKWVTSGKLYQRWKYQTKRSTPQGGAMQEPSEREKEIIQKVRRQYLGKTPIITVGRDLSKDEIEHFRAAIQAEMANPMPCVIVSADMELQIIPPSLTIDELAKEIHDSGREAFELGATVAAEKFKEENRKYIEWEELTDHAREGRRLQAKALLEKFIIVPREA